MATNWRNVEPTAMGLTPPPFLFRAISEAPKKKVRIEEGTRPLRTRLAKDVRAARRPPLNLPGKLNKSLRCCGLRPSGPPADPLGKDPIAEETASGVAKTLSMVSTAGGIKVRGWRGRVLLLECLEGGGIHISQGVLRASQSDSTPEVPFL